MRCRRQAPTGRHANPTLVGGSDDEAADTNRCRQERLPCGGSECPGVVVNSSKLNLTDSERDRAVGILVGAAAGDALGAGYEFGG